MGRPSCWLRKNAAHEVDVEHRVPGVVGDVDGVVAVDDAGVVHEDVDLVLAGEVAADGGDGG